MGPSQELMVARGASLQCVEASRMCMIGGGMSKSFEARSSIAKEATDPAICSALRPALHCIVPQTAKCAVPSRKCAFNRR